LQGAQCLPIYWSANWRPRAHAQRADIKIVFRNFSLRIVTKKIGKMPKSEEKLVFDRKLKDFFKTCRYPNRAQKQALAEELKKPVNTISNWFNRHRREDRKERQKAISNNFVINFFQNMHPYPSNSEKSQNKLCQKLRDKILRRKKEKAQNRPTEGKMFTQIFRTYGQIIKIVTGAKRRRAFRQNSKFSKIFIFDQNFDF